MATTRGIFPIGDRTQNEREYAAQAERERREQTIAGLARHYGAMSLFPEAVSSKTRPVFCIELNRWFSSSSEAASTIAGLAGKSVKRAHVRTALKRGSRLHRYTLSYDGPEGKPRSRYSLTCHARAVQNVETGKEFRSLREAGQFVGRSELTIRRACEKGHAVNGLHFELAGERTRGLSQSA
jgi:hypothetical protein